MNVLQTAAEGTNTFGRENSSYPVLGTYEEGAIIEMKVVVSTFHWVSKTAQSFFGPMLSNQTNDKCHKLSST